MLPMLLDEIRMFVPYGIDGIFKMLHNTPEHDVLLMFRDANEEVLQWVRTKTPARERKIASLIDMVLHEKQSSPFTA